MHLKTLGLAAALAIGATFPAMATESASPPVRGPVLFWLLDRNDSGVIDHAEIVALRAVIFDAFDLDHDGKLTRAEAAATAETTRMRVADRVAAAIKAGPGKIAERRALFANRLGLDQPGGLSRDDFISRDPRLMAQADANADGGISRDEFDAVANFLGGTLLPQ